MRKQTILKFTTLVMTLLISVLLINACGDIEGNVKENIPPTVEFVTVPQDSSLFTAAPMIYWKGSDSDGFVEYYAYADITDSAATRSAADAKAFYSQIPDEAWIETHATEQRIYLLTEPGEVSDHVFYIRCYDDQGAVSQDTVYRTFFRSNNAPNTPSIGMTTTAEDDMSDALYVTDTLYCIDSITEAWSGLQFRWRGNDPDDKAYYTIPLQFKPILVKAPGDTIYEGLWNDDQDITLVGLETGFYTLYVWSRDDGYTLSPSPARIEFNVINPTFYNNVLIVLEANNVEQMAWPALDSLEAFYSGLMDDIKLDIDPDFLASDESGQNPNPPSYYDIYSYGPNSIVDSTDVVPKSMLHQYKLIIYVDDQFRLSAMPDRYMAKRNDYLTDYLRVGGRLWYQGRMLTPNVLWGYTVGQQRARDRILRDEFFGIDSIYGNTDWNFPAGVLAEFIGTQPGLVEFDSLFFSDSLYENFDTTLASWRNELQYGLAGAMSIARQEDVTTTQYFISVTDTLEGIVFNEDSEVISGQVQLGNTVVEYQPTTTNCVIRTDEENILTNGVSRVVNLTRQEADPNSNWEGEVVTINNNIVFVSYMEGEPWSDDDVLEVDYEYNPRSNFHLTPCEVRYERVETVASAYIMLRYRTAMTTFTYYFMDYPGARTAWVNMINWMLNPGVN